METLPWGPPYQHLTISCAHLANKSQNTGSLQSCQSGTFYECSLNTFLYEEAIKHFPRNQKAESTAYYRKGTWRLPYLIDTDSSSTNTPENTTHYCPLNFPFHIKVDFFMSTPKELVSCGFLCLAPIPSGEWFSGVGPG